jgi:hypothetical protein
VPLTIMFVAQTSAPVCTSICVPVPYVISLTAWQKTVPVIEMIHDNIIVQNLFISALI